MAQTSNAEILLSNAGIRTFRNVGPGDGGKFDLSSPIGTTGIQNCVGMYIQLDEATCYCAHIFCSQSVMADLSSKESAHYRSMVGRYHDLLLEKTGSSNVKYHDTLLVACSQPNMGSKAMMDAIFLWAGLSEDDERKWKCRQPHSGFVVIHPRPANADFEILTGREEGEWEGNLVYGNGECHFPPVRPEQADWCPFDGQESKGAERAEKVEEVCVRDGVVVSADAMHVVGG